MFSVICWCFAIVFAIASRVESFPDWKDDAAKNQFVEYSAEELQKVLLKPIFPLKYKAFVDSMGDGVAEEVIVQNVTRIIIDVACLRGNTIEKLFEVFFAQTKCIPILLYVTGYLFWKLMLATYLLHVRSEVDSKFLTAHYVNELKRKPGYDSLSAEKLRALQGLIDYLPVTAMSLESNADICFRNVHHSKYICEYGTGDKLKLCRHISKASRWIVTRCTEYKRAYYFESKNEVGFYLGTNRMIWYAVGLEKPISWIQNPRRWRVDLRVNGSAIIDIRSGRYLCYGEEFQAFHELYISEDLQLNHCLWILEECGY